MLVATRVSIASTNSRCYLWQNDPRQKFTLQNDQLAMLYSVIIITNVISPVSIRCLVLLVSNAHNCMFSSTGDLELLYIAKNDSDAFACAALADDVARYINSLRTGSSRPTRKRRQAAADSTAVDPIFNYMTIASPLEQEMHNGTTGDGTGDGTDDDGSPSYNSGVEIFSAPCTLIFALVLLLKLIMN